MRIAIIGAGISGLTAAHQLKKSGVEVFLLEKSSRAGGWIRSFRHKGFLFEQGPRSCRVRGNGKATLELAEELGLASEIILPGPHVNKRFLYEKGELRSLMRLKWLAAAWRERKIPSSLSDDESLDGFFRRRFGADLTESLIDAMTSGIFAGDPKTLSVRSCFPPLWKWEQELGSVVKGMRQKKKKTLHPLVGKAGIFSFRNGMEQLVDALASKLKDELHLNTPVEEISFANDQFTLVSGEQSFVCDHLISAIPAHHLAPLLPNLPLAPFTRASSVVINIGFHKKVLSREGFGYLVPYREQEEVLGMVWDSAVFPQQNGSSEETRLTLIAGGARRPEMVEKTKDELTELALTTLKDHLGITVTPDALSIGLAKEAIPQYTVGHHKQLEKLTTDLPLTLIGNSYRGVSVNDCIADANKAAREFGFAHATCLKT